MFNLLYPQPKSVTELELVTDEFYEIFQGVSENYFVAACRAYKKRKKWFPVPADLQEEYDLIVKNIIPEVKQLPLPELTPEQAEENRRWIREHLRLKGLGSRNRKQRSPIEAGERQDHTEKVREQASAILSGDLQL